MRRNKFNRIRGIQYFFIFFSCVIVFRTLQLQFSSETPLSRLANRQFKMRVTALPRRGSIYDRNGNGLALSLKARSLYVRPQILREKVNIHIQTKLSSQVARILGLPQKRVLEKFQSSKSFIWLKRQLSETEERRLKSLEIEDLDDGLGLAEESRRLYPNRELAANAIGTVNIDGQGIEGLELAYEDILSGESARISSLKDARGRSIFEDDHGLLAFKDGRSIKLTIDKSIQYESDKAIQNAVTEYKAQSGIAIVASVETGAILGISHFPTYDPNSAKSAPNSHKRIRAITDTFEPGSTLKPLIIEAALEKGIPVSTQVYCEKGKFHIADRIISEAETHEQYEWLSLSEIIMHSSNIGAAKVAITMGSNYLLHFIDRLGLNSKTGIDLPGESSGATMTRNEMIQELASPVRLANIGFGQGITLTPIQLLSYYQALANGGVWKAPHLVESISDETNQNYSERVIGQRKIFSPMYTKAITKMLESVVTKEGTGIQAQIAEWPVAGKTGTSQKIDPETKKYSRTKHISTFVGFAPASHPVLVGLVILDEPTVKFYAGETAAPTFRDIMRASLQHLNIPPEVDKPKSTESPSLAMAYSLKKLEKSEDDAQAQVETDDKSRIKLPDLKGLTIRETLNAVPVGDLNVQVIGSGILKSQSPPAGEWLRPGSKVKLYFTEENH